MFSLDWGISILLNSKHAVINATVAHAKHEPVKSQVVGNRLPVTETVDMGLIFNNLRFDLFENQTNVTRFSNRRSVSNAEWVKGANG